MKVAPGKPGAVTAAEQQRFLDEAGPVVRAIMIKMLHASLSPSDSRHQNEEALDLYHQSIAKAWQGFIDPEGKPIEDLRAYAATTARNMVNDHLRLKYPNRFRLRGQLKRFFAREAVEPSSKFRSRKDNKGKAWYGLGEWPLGTAPGTIGRLVDLERDPARFGLGHLVGKLPSSLESSDVARLVSIVLERAAGPLLLPQLVNACVRILKVEEDRFISIDAGDGDEEDGPPPVVIADESANPAERVEMRERFRVVWEAVNRLERRYRLSFLLNPPFGMDIGVFVEQRVTTITEIGTALELDDKNYAFLLDMKLLQDDKAGGKEGGALAREVDATTERRIFQLWNQLPLNDNVIAQLIEVSGRQTVINLRNQARDMVQRMLTRDNGAHRR
jgi:RNA polymerase sigma factor (sigma-70 family)